MSDGLWSAYPSPWVRSPFSGFAQLLRTTAHHPSPPRAHSETRVLHCIRGSREGAAFAVEACTLRSWYLGAQDPLLRLPVRGSCAEPSTFVPRSARRPCTRVRIAHPLRLRALPRRMNRSVRGGTRRSRRARAGNGHRGSSFLRGMSS